jgi:hypothetical protein
MASKSSAWSALSALPVEMRADWQRIITEDVAAQQKLPPQGPMSRAYASGEIRPSVPGLVKKVLGGEDEGHIPQSTDALLAQLLQHALADAKVQPTGLLGSALKGDNLQALAALLNERGLDAAYRVVLAKFLQKRAATDEEYATPEGPTRYPHVAALVSGELATRATASWEAWRGEHGAGDAATAGQARPSPVPTAAPAMAAPAPAAAGAGDVGATAAGGDLDLDALLDDVLS